MIKKIIKNILNYTNFRIVHKDNWYERQVNLIPEISDEDFRFIKSLENYSMCPPAAHWSIIQSIKYISQKKIAGDFVECGVFKGGNLILMNHQMKKLNLSKKIFAFDTFDGMSEPTVYDKDLKDKSADKTFNNYKDRNEKWCYGSLEEVKKNLEQYDKNYQNNFNLIKGKVEDTLKKNDNLPDKISLLRLDTDFYESTKIELEVLYPRLSKGGILIIDDYGHWKGSQKAVDEYLDLKNNFYFLHRVDYGTRLLIKDN
jgi:O-methyltransferase